MSDNHVNRRTVLGAVGTTVVGGMLATGSAAAEGHAETFSAELTGAAEVPPVETNASGRATFEVAEDGSAVHFQVYIDCIQNVTQGHIHLGAEGENGPVVVWLYPQDTREPTLLEGVRRDFVLAEGTLTEEDLVGDFEGESLGSLAEAMREEGVYVNIHSEQNPAGEIRGQIVPDEEAEAPEVDEPVEEPEEPPEEEEEPEEEPEEEEEEEPEEEEEEEEEEVDVDVGDALEVVDMQVNVGHDTDNEYIIFENTSDTEINLGGYVVTDRDDSGTAIEAVFPNGFTLGPNEQVRVTSGYGEPSDDEIFMESGRAVWRQGGDVIRVLDPNGNVVFEHEYGDGGASSIQFVFSVLRSLFA